MSAHMKVIRSLLLPLWLLLGSCLTCVLAKDRPTQEERRDLAAQGRISEMFLIDRTNFKNTKLPIFDGAVISLADLGLTEANFNLVAETAGGPFKSVKFVYSKTGYIRTENIEPYALCGDKSSNYFKCHFLSKGHHTIQATPFTLKNARGEAGASSTVSFTIVNEASTPNAVSVTGELRKWHKITLAFTGPFASETDTAINPFLDYRLDVTFTHERGKQYVVPGFYAADGNAADTSASEGDQWFCHFAPDEAGKWTYMASFVQGPNVAVSTTGSSGTPTSFHGATGSFAVDETNKTGRDHRGKGRLNYVNKHHLQFAGTGEWFLKAGADSPENFLAYEDFDNTVPSKSWEPHLVDYNEGDPTWAGGKGKGIIGAINYLSSKGMNAFSFLTMNIQGDDKNVFPYIGDQESDWVRMDVSKLAQWEIVFEHADKMGMFLHFKTQEQENDQLLDGGELDVERKLYYRELIARFSHHLALNWNLGEEITNEIEQIKDFCDYFAATDPYRHPVVAHTFPNKGVIVYNAMLGHSTFDGPSIQTKPVLVHELTKKWRDSSLDAGHPWVVTNDEQNSQYRGVMPDSVADNNQALIRKRVLWGNIMAGGAGVEYYFGYAYACSDLTCEDYRSREKMWDVSAHALSFFRDNAIPFWDMESDNDRVLSGSNDWVLSNNADCIVLYRRDKTGGTIALTGLSGTFSVAWYNPRNGGSLEDGTVATLTGGTNASYGVPLSAKASAGDWVVLIRKQ